VGMGGGSSRGEGGCELDLTSKPVEMCQPSPLVRWSLRHFRYKCTLGQLTSFTHWNVNLYAGLSFTVWLSCMPSQITGCTHHSENYLVCCQLFSPWIVLFICSVSADCSANRNVKKKSTL
jgi:hypothetical protein